MARRSVALERDFQPELKKEIRARFPGCYIFKLDSSEYQGIPDLLILFGSQWAILEVKRSSDSDFQPNQEWYIDQFNQMSFSSVIFPENKEAVLDDLQQTFGTRRSPRYNQRQ